MLELLTIMGRKATIVEFSDTKLLIGYSEQVTKRTSKQTHKKGEKDKTRNTVTKQQQQAKEENTHRTADCGKTQRDK